MLFLYFTLIFDVLGSLSKSLHNGQKLHFLLHE